MKVKFGFENLDANESALFLRQAEYIMAQTYDVVYPQYTALQYLPISGEGGAGIREITYRQFDSTGVAKIVNNFATDFPRVDVKGKEFTQKVRGVGDSYGYNNQEISEAQTANLPLDAMRARNAREIIVRKLNKIGWFGDAQSGLRGLLSHPSITKAAATTGTWSSATTTQILKDVNDAIQGPYILSKGVETVDTCLIGHTKYSLLATTPYSTLNPATLLSILKEANPGVLFAPVFELTGLAINPRTLAAGPVDAIVTFRRDASKIWFALPLDFTQWQPAWDGSEWTIKCYARTGGVICPYPLSARITDGI